MNVEPIAAVGTRVVMPAIPVNQPMQATLVGHGGHGSASGAGGMREAMTSLQEMSSRVFGSGMQGPGAMLAGVERAAISSITPQDYLRTSLAATDLSMHVSMSMMKFHLSSSLGSAVTGLFNTLLKNRD